MGEIINGGGAGADAPAIYEIGGGGDTTLAVRLAQAELNQSIVTARQYPRSVARAMRSVMDLVNLDKKSAEECIYALPRGGKPIRGPSIRFAEIVASAWGNCHVGSRVVAVDLQDKVVIAEGVFWDLESGLKRVAQVRRRITDKRGQLFNDDMIVVTGNAACSIAMREAILKGVPKAIWRAAYDAAEAAIAGDVKTLVERRGEAMKAFAAWGVKPELIFEALEIGGLDDIGTEELATLRAMVVSIRNQEATVESYFPALAGGKGKAAPPPKAETAKAEAKAEPQQDAPPKGGEAAAEPQEPPKGRKAKAQAEPPREDEPAASDEPAGGGEAPDASAHLQSAYNAILADAMDAGAARARAANAAIIETIRQQAPDLHARLEEELAAFEAAGADDA